MILKWGGYSHQQDEVGIRISKRAIKDSFNRVMAYVHDWDILGTVHAADQAGITTALTGLETAYQTGDKDLCLYLNDGSTKTKHELVTANMFGGTTVEGFGYISGPWKMGVEYANQRTFFAKIQAEERVTTDNYFGWKERLRIQGTGAQKWRYMPQLSGAPVAQILQTQTPFFYIQSGVAYGRTSYINPPGPLYPGIEHADQRVVEYDTARDIRISGKKEIYRTSWTYVMEATVAQGFSAFVVPSV